MTVLPIDEARSPTHGGGVVVRRGVDAREFLVLTSSKNPAHWVLPKGHVDPGETPSMTAVREVEEESGECARIVETLAETELALPHELQHVRWFLMEWSGKGRAIEGRQVVWLPLQAALERLTFEDARELVRRAEIQLSAREARS